MIARLESQGFIEPPDVEERGRRPYRITAAGRRAFATRLAELQLLGFEGRVVELTATETAVLHALLLRAETIVPQRELIAALWPDVDPAACKNRLYAHVFTLRRKLANAAPGAKIQGSRRGYRLELEAA